jgi:hypothetical protein
VLASANLEQRADRERLVRYAYRTRRCGTYHIPWNQENPIAPVCARRMNSAIAIRSCGRPPAEVWRDPDRLPSDAPRAREISGRNIRQRGGPTRLVRRCSVHDGARSPKLGGDSESKPVPSIRVMPAPGWRAIRQSARVGIRASRARAERSLRVRPFVTREECCWPRAEADTLLAALSGATPGHQRWAGPFFGPDGGLKSLARYARVVRRVALGAVLVTGYEHRVHERGNDPPPRRRRHHAAGQLQRGGTRLVVARRRYPASLASLFLVLSGMHRFGLVRRARS